MHSNLSILNDPPSLLAGPRFLHQLIHWDEHHNSCAIDFTINEQRQTYTYREAEACVHSLVRRIQAVLATDRTQNHPQHIIPVVLPQSPGLYISQLAILESGGAFCPINLDAPKERIKFVVGDVAANIIITTSEFKDLVSWENGPRVILVDEFPVVPERETLPRDIRPLADDDLAYVMYTSGSSGTPKGVAVGQIAASQSLLVHDTLIPPFERFLQFAAPSFDVSVFEIFFPLTRGRTLVGCNRSQLLNDLPGMINTLKIDAAELTPTVVGSLLQKRENAPGLKLLLTIGEMLTTPIVTEFGGSDSKESILFGMYGPTEAAIHCTIHPDMRANAKPGNIGVPFENVSAYVAAAESVPGGEVVFLPIGDLGELVLGGPQLAQGYLNREEQNKAAFVRCHGKSYYRTGDKARMLEDGTIEILGRMSSGQVKLRGQRVELGEIEEAVYKHPGMKTVVAVVLGSVLIVFALVDDTEMQTADVLTTCSKWLPSFMVPSEIVLLSKFPYLPSGKVNKRELEANYQKTREQDGNNEESSSPTQRLVKQILQEVLGPFPSSTRLAAAGLDSLVAIRVAGKLRTAGFEVTTVAVLKADTLASLVTLCGNSQSIQSPPKGNKSAIDQADSLAVLNGHAKDVELTLPCTPLQTAMLAETALNEKAYRNWVELDLVGVSDSDFVRSALHRLASHNPILRTGFAESSSSDGYVQFVWNSFSDSQIEDVSVLNYDFDTSRDISIHHPVRFQILWSKSKSKLLMHIHHALYDAWSLELLLDDLDTLLSNQSPSPRPSFAEVVDAYANQILSTDSWASKDYWRDHLVHLDIRHIPNFHTQEAASTGLAMALHPTSISTSDIEIAARKLASSPQSIFQAAFALILGSYLGSSDICFGTVFSGRTHPIVGIEDIVGPCLSTLPIRVDTSASHTLQELIQELNSTNRKHLEHSTVPLRAINAAAGVNPRQQLFDTLLIWQQTLHSYDVSREHVSVADTLDNLEFNLTLEIIPSRGNVEFKANYQQSIFPRSQIDLLLRQVEQLVLTILSDEKTPLQNALEKICPDVLSIENPTPDVRLSHETLSSPVEKMAIQEPNRPAIQFARTITSESIDVESMSYSELNKRANQMAHLLLQQAVLPDDLVCICLEKSIDLYASILATAKAGAGYLPVTPETPFERLKHILDEAKVKVLMAHSVSRPLLEQFNGLRVVYVDEVDFANFPAENITSKFVADNLSYCVFTSGSTGTPKGVLVTQGNLLSNLDVLKDLYPASKEAKLLQSCSQAFDVSVFEIFYTWRIGGCLCSAVKDVLFRDIENAIRLMDVSHLSLTPTVAALIDPKNVPKVTFLVTAGEAVTQKVFNAWSDHGLYQGYGPSETTNICTVNPKVSKQDSINNIGPPFRNTSAFVLASGPDFSIVPRGGEGEFCFGGSQVFRGYMNQSQNVGKIIDHPSYGRLYRSGDFGRLMPDGSLAFTGRKDDQVKIRGQRVELGEINNVMLTSSEVRDCVTMVINHNAAQRLVCFWTSGLQTTSELKFLPPDPQILTKLYDTLQSALPSYMIPSSLIPISLLPPTSQGKIDKRVLLKLYESLDVKYLESTAQSSRTSSNHTWTDLQLKIAESVAELTKVPVQDVGPDTSFFSVGIDSISAIALSRLLRQACDCQVEISDILKHPSVTRLSEIISSKAGNDELSTTTKAIESDFGFEPDFQKATIDVFKQAGRSVQHIAPCTPLQEAMLSAAESSAEALYSNHVVFDVSGDMDVLRACWGEMVQRHEILRTCFLRTDHPRYPYVQVVLEEHQLRFVSRVGEAKQVIQEVEQTVQNEYDPPYSFVSFQASGRKQLLISMHHALYDGVALSVLYDEVEKLYQHQSLQPAVSFKPFLQHMVSTNLEASDKFWNTALEGCSPTSFDNVEQKVSNSEPTSTRISRIAAKAPLSWIEESAKKHSTTLLAVCHASWAGLLSERLHETDVCFGNVVSGRTVPIEDIERLVAPCFNTIPARLVDIHKLSYLEAFRLLQTFNAESLPFQLTPLRRLQSKFSPDGSRLFDSLLILQQPTTRLDASIWSIAEDNGVMDFPLVCEIVPNHSDDTLDLVLHSYTSVFSEADAQSILESFSRNLQTALQSPRRQIISSEAKEQMLAKAIAVDEKKGAQDVELRDAGPALSDLEVQIRGVIADFTSVSVEKIGRDTSIFRLGLDSISTVQVASRLRKLGFAILASDVLEHPSIGRLGSFLASTQSRPGKVRNQYDFVSFENQFRKHICSRTGVSSDAIAAVRPCTAVQSGMIAQTLHSDGREYVNSMYFELESDKLLLAFKEAWIEVCNGHEMLRTGFAATGDASNPFAMIVYTKDHFTLPWHEEDHATNLSSDDLLHQPWSLTILRESSQNMVRFTAHHALYDAQSVQMILSDVNDIMSGKAAVARPSVVSMLESILLEAEGDIEEKKSFWQQDENKIVVNKFPDLTPLRVSSGEDCVCEVASTASFGELEAACRDSGVTMQAAGQAAWARLLAAYIGESATTFGMTLSGRSVSEDAEMVSFPSIVTLPVRCNVLGSNKDLLARTMGSNAQLHRHQFTPLTSIQKWAGFPEGKTFDTLFAYQKLADDNTGVSLPWKVVREDATVDYAVSMEVQPSKSGQLLLRLSFKNDLVPVEQADLILRQYDALLLDLLRNPDHPCDVAPSLGPKMLSITPASENELPDSVKLLHQYVERGAQQWPDKIAFEFATSLEPGHFESQTWTYKRLDQDANKVARLLLDRGAVAGDIIAVCFDKCPQASITIIGVLKAGCAYVALDPNAPADRVKFILKDSAAKLVVSAGKPGNNLNAALDGRIISLDSLSILDGYSSEPPELSRLIHPQDTSYCLYTSGTTGTPKGCLLSHENAVQAMLAFQRLFTPHWTPESKWLQFASFHFDVSVLEQFWSWSVGICVASAPRDLIFEDIPGAIQQLGITHIDLTPSLARLLHPDDVPSLCKGVFITGGEQLKQEILDVWGEHGCIYNGYGPTEATIGVTMFPRVPRNGKPANIGPQFDNVGSFVLKPATSLPVLRGGIGELCVSGKLVGKGYLNRPDLTVDRFPTLEGFNERVYRTGDLVRILHDGSFIFLGRADDQVKLRGQRLELGEINEVIKKSRSDLDEVVTLVLKHSTQAKEQLVTFFVCSARDSDSGSVISAARDACKARLPGYMVPTHFIPIDALPLNPNNKADSKQLAAMYNDLGTEELHKLSHSGLDDRDWTSAETRVLRVLAGALGVEASALGRGTNLFELGLDSISIIGFSQTLQNAGFENAKLSVVKSNPSMDALVAVLLNNAASDPEKENAYVLAAQDIAVFSQKHLADVCTALHVQAADVDAIAPCTPVQEGMIYRFLESDHALYFNKFEFRSSAKILDNSDFEKAWRRLRSNIQALRTKFVLTNDGYAQVVMKKPGNSLTDSPEGLDKHAMLENPTSCCLVTEEHASISLTIFHGLYDGNSLSMMLDCFVKELKGVAEIEYGPSFHSSLAYGPLAKMPAAREFWTEHLEEWSFQPMAEHVDSSETVVVKSAFRDLDNFEKIRKHLAVAPQAMIQAAWISALQCFSSPQSTIGVVTSGRAIDFEGADRVIGPLFNTIPFHMRIRPGTTLSLLVQQCHDVNMRMQDFQHTPLKDVQKWSPAKTGQSLFDTLFVFQRPEPNEEGFADDGWTQVEDAHVADYPLAFEASLNHDNTELSMVIVAQGSVVSQSEAHDLLGKMQEALGDILSGGEKMVEANVKNGDSAYGSGTSGGTPEEGNRIAQVNGSFKWTESTEQIRREIAVLTGIDEESVHADSSIFELGLDSIDVIKLCSRLKKQGIHITVSALIKSQTIARMADQISLAGQQQSPAASGRFQDISRDLAAHLGDRLPRDCEMVMPATPLQHSMINAMMGSAYKRYFTMEAFVLGEEIDLSRLLQAVDTVVSHSPILRTTFVEVDDPRSPVSYAQVVHKNGPEHSSMVYDASDDESIEALMDRFLHELVDSGAVSRSLCHIRCTTIGQSRYMIMGISHALYDGRSLRALHEDIGRAYSGSFTPRPDPLPFLEEVFTSTTEDAKQFWKSTLSNLAPAAFPKKSLPSTETSQVHRLDKQSQVALPDIETFCKSTKITLQTLGQTCWSLVLAHLMGQLDVVFGSVLSCRDSEEADEVMFPLMNTVAVRSVLHGNVADMLTYMQEMSDSARQFQHFPLGLAQAFALASRDQALARDTTLFDTLFIYQGRRPREESDPLYTSVYGASEVEFPVCVEMEIVDDAYLSWSTACKAIACDAAETEKLLEALDVVLQVIVSDARVPTIVSDAEGISVCGLPRFKKRETTTKRAYNKSSDAIDEEWSLVEMDFRKALHELSGAPEDTIEKDSTIFHLGLDSILVLKLPKLLKKYGIKISVSEILRHLTIASMAASVQGEKSNENETETVDVDAILEKANSSQLPIMPPGLGEVKYAMPVSAGQLYTIRRWQESRGALFYATFTYNIAEQLDKKQLDIAWKALLQRHDILRTGFFETSSGTIQVCFQKPPNEVLYLPATHRTTLIRKNLPDLHQPPINLVISESATGTKLNLIIHHALYDGISIGILLQELQALYRSQDLPPPPHAFKSFVAQSLVSSTSATQHNWTQYLGSTKPPPTAPKTHSSNRTEVFQPSLPFPSLQTKARSLGVTTDALLLARLSQILAPHSSDSSPVILGLYHANRSSFPACPFPTLNLLPLQIAAPRRRGVAEIARAVQRDLGLIGGREMVGASLEQIHGWTGVRVDCFVNILKLGDASESAAASSLPSAWQSDMDLGGRADVVPGKVNSAMEMVQDDAYLPSTDIEIRYHGDTDARIDVGVFAPEDVFSVRQAQDMIGEFLGGWD